MEKKPKKLISICKKCNFIRGYTVSDDTWKRLKAGLDKPLFTDGINTAASGYSVHLSSTANTSTFVSSTFGGSTWSWSHPLQCDDCSSSCKICLQHDGTIAGFMDKCDKCEHKFLCATNRADWEQYGSVETVTSVGNSAAWKSDIWKGVTYDNAVMARKNRSSKTKRVGRVFLNNFKGRFRKKQVPV